MADDFKIEWQGLDELIDLFDGIESNAESIVMDEMNDLGLLAEEGARALAPHDTGDLEDKLNFDKATREGNNLVVRGGSNLKYALRRHEEPYRAGTHPKYEAGRKYPGYYVDGRGQRTRTKPSWRGYEPGRKYLENAMKAIEPDHEQMGARALKRMLEGGK